MSVTAHRNEIDLEQAVEGMILATALLDAHGGVLLPQDATLTAATLASLRRRGIERCVVWSEAEAPDPAALARARALQLERLERLFRHSAGSDGGALLLARLRAYREGPVA
ncbi:MAG: hypothetical protein V4476_06080 [Pseudomonadota bacterium]